VAKNEEKIIKLEAKIESKRRKIESIQKHNEEEPEDSMFQAWI
jgi:hypothetical protein